MPVLPGSPINLFDVLLCNVVCYDPETEQLGLNTLHYQAVAQAGLPVTELDVAQELDRNYELIYKAVLAIDVEYVGCTCRNLTNIPITPTYLFATHRGPGVVPGVTGPGQITILISKRTNFAGPSGRGRSYVPFVPRNNIALDNKLLAGALPDYDTIAQTMLFELDVFNVPLTGSIKLRPVLYQSPPTVVTPIVSTSASIYFATQRRRGAFGQPNLAP